MSRGRWWGTLVVVAWVTAAMTADISTRVIAAPPNTSESSDDGVGDGRLRQISLDCNSPSCCGYTKSSVGCRFQGRRCRCPFVIPRPVPFTPYDIYHHLRRQRPTYQDDQDRR
ncbi:hypothetical protein Hamer_G008954 [Homarus americanus]|uniref:Uncharacterized protein n=1 Tax=Homarus americanus TaxID=6706 RepID=A0A8J5JLP9_HOMAM|nr:hypothetical protein Hamer_G008954 [Homarus americanus]